MINCKENKAKSNIRNGNNKNNPPFYYSPRYNCDGMPYPLTTS